MDKERGTSESRRKEEKRTRMGGGEMGERRREKESRKYGRGEKGGIKEAGK